MGQNHRAGMGSFKVGQNGVAIARKDHGLIVIWGGGSS